MVRSSLSLNAKIVAKALEVRKCLRLTEMNMDGDRLLCFTSKYLADPPELEHHAESPDSITYIRDYIPETTKRMFAL